MPAGTPHKPRKAAAPPFPSRCPPVPSPPARGGGGAVLAARRSSGQRQRAGPWYMAPALAAAPALVLPVPPRPAEW